MLFYVHLHNLLDMKTVKSSPDKGNLRNLYDNYPLQIRNLESLGVKSDIYSSLLCSLLLKLISPDLTLEFSRKLNDTKCGR